MGGGDFGGCPLEKSGLVMGDTHGFERSGVEYFGGSPVKCFAGVDEMVKCSDGFFHWTGTIGSVGVYEVYIFELETL